MRRTTLATTARHKPRSRLKRGHPSPYLTPLGAFGAVLGRGKYYSLEPRLHAQVSSIVQFSTRYTLPTKGSPTL